MMRIEVIIQWDKMSEIQLVMWLGNNLHIYII
jgi:hypothetical protein